MKPADLPAAFAGDASALAPHLAALGLSYGLLAAGLAPSGGTALKLAEQYLEAAGPLFAEACREAHARLLQAQRNSRAETDRTHLLRLLEAARRARALATPEPPA